MSGLKPGLTMNLAPASSARSSWSWVSTVPAPTSISGTSRLMARIAASPAAVRKVTSATGSPPATSAFANGTAFSASSMAMTGTMPISEICFGTGCMDRPSFLCSSGNGQMLRAYTQTGTKGKTPHPASAPDIAGTRSDAVVLSGFGGGYLLPFSSASHKPDRYTAPSARS